MDVQNYVYTTELLVKAVGLTPNSLYALTSPDFINFPQPYEVTPFLLLILLYHTRKQTNAYFLI